MREAEARFGVQNWMPIAAVVLSLSVGGLTSWILKIDDRVFTMNHQMVVDDDIKSLRKEMVDANAAVRAEVATIKTELRDDLKGMEKRLGDAIAATRKQNDNAR